MNIQKVSVEKYLEEQSKKLYDADKKIKKKLKNINLCKNIRFVIGVSLVLALLALVLGFNPSPLALPLAVIGLAVLVVCLFKIDIYNYEIDLLKNEKDFIYSIIIAYETERKDG